MLSSSNARPSGRRAGARTLVTAGPFAALRRRLINALDDSGTPDVLVVRLAGEAAAAIMSATGPSAATMSRLAPLADAFGERHARLGHGSAALKARLDAAAQAVHLGLARELRALLPTRDAELIRTRAVALMRALSAHADAAHRQVIWAASMPPESRSAHLQARIFGSMSTLGHLIEFAGLDVTVDYRPLVSRSTPLPHPSVTALGGLVSSDPREAVVPAASDLAEMLEVLAGQIVLGPSVAIQRLPEAVGFTRRLAQLLRQGIVIDDRRVVPCVDLIGHLLTTGNDIVAEVLVDKHLGELERRPLPRRIALAEFLLNWLERGLSLHQLARELGMAPQTAHDWSKTLRTIFGPALADPVTRVELMLALPAALRRWRSAEESAPDLPRPRHRDQSH